jgi:catalase
MSINQTKPAGELHNWELNSLTTNAGASVDNAKMSQTLGPRGPVLLQDFALIESLQVQNRERIPERVVHARGMTVKGEFTCTDDVSDLTIADFLQTPGKTTKLAARLSTVIHSKDSPEYLRDVRGFALKLYTQQGNYDMVGNVWPVFFVRDGIRFPEMVRALKPNPRTNNQEWWRIWDFFSNYPESTHAFTFLLDDIGIPKSYRHLNGFSINTYKMVNAQGRETFFRWRIESELGEVGQLDEEACKQNFSAHSRDLMDAIDRGEFPKYNFFIQTMTEDQFPTTFDPLDATKDWPLDQFPKRKIGEMIFNENIDGFFAESESIAFAPSRMVPGIEPSDDKLLQSRLFAYADTQTYRLGINNQMLPINAPQCPFRDSHVDGVMHFRKKFTWITRCKLLPKHPAS